MHLRVMVLDVKTDEDEYHGADEDDDGSVHRSEMQTGAGGTKTILQ